MTAETPERFIDLLNEVEQQAVQEGFKLEDEVSAEVQAQLQAAESCELIVQDLQSA